MSENEGYIILKDRHEMCFTLMQKKKKEEYTNLPDVLGWYTLFSSHSTNRGHYPK